MPRQRATTSELLTEIAEAIVLHADLLRSGSADITSEHHFLASGLSKDRLDDLFHHVLFPGRPWTYDINRQRRPQCLRDNGIVIAAVVHEPPSCPCAPLKLYGILVCDWCLEQV